MALTALTKNWISLTICKGSSSWPHTCMKSLVLRRDPCQNIKMFLAHCLEYKPLLCPTNSHFEHGELGALVRFLKKRVVAAAVHMTHISRYFCKRSDFLAPFASASFLKDTSL